MTQSGGDTSANPMESAVIGVSPRSRRWLRGLGWLGVLLAAPFFLWLPLGLITPLPSMIDVFGVVGLRVPASITIAGLLLAAVGFHRF